MSEARPFTINRYPRGLIALLNSKAEGTTPHIMGPVVQPGIDLSAYYELETPLQQAGACAIAINAAGMFAGVGNAVVPQGQIWRLRSASLNMGGLGVGTTYKLALCVAWNSQVSSVIYTALTPAVTYTATEVPTIGWTGDLWLQATDGLAVACSNFVAGTAQNPSLVVTGTRFTL